MELNSSSNSGTRRRGGTSGKTPHCRTTVSPARLTPILAGFGARRRGITMFCWPRSSRAVPPLPHTV